MTDYKSTLNLPKTDFPMKADLPVREPQQVARWESMGLYEQIRRARRGTKKFILHDGPPYANGDLHLGHLLNKTLKDTVVRYKTMQGFDSPMIPGWDCHGMPIEVQLLKELGLAKEGLPKDRVTFRAQCRAYAQRFINHHKEQLKRLGVLGDWNHSYHTMDPAYVAVILKSFVGLVERGYVYRGLKPVMWCQTCTTALAEAEVEYATRQSPSMYVGFPVMAGQGMPEGTMVAIWTTTPWTLPGNVAIAVHPDSDYEVCEMTLQSGVKRIVLLARKLMTVVAVAIGAEPQGKLLKVVKGREMQGLKCRHPFMDRESVVVTALHVSMDDGTGCVHTAPGHGKEDFQAGLEHALPVIMPVDEHGRFTKEFSMMEGVNVFEANARIVDLVNQAGNLLAPLGEIQHSYPHCWRCHGPLIVRATRQWFMNVDHQQFRQRLMESLSAVQWFPPESANRIRSMVEGRPDWCLSRQRVWGVPIPVIFCTACDTPVLDAAVIGFTVERLIQSGGIDQWLAQDVASFVRPGTSCAACGGQAFRRDPDILDVWMDSSFSHAAVLDTNPDLHWPADVVVEATDMHRAWFQVSAISSMALKDRLPFQRVVTHGWVVDAYGEKFSKSKGNFVSVPTACASYGADLARLIVISQDYYSDIQLTETLMEQVRELYRKIRNTCRFALSNLYDYDPVRDHPERTLSVSKGESKDDPYSPLDRWARSRLHAFVEGATKDYNDFAFHRYVHRLQQFCIIDLSSVYFDVLKDRLYTWAADAPERREAQHILFDIVKVLAKTMAPVMPFTAEEVWSFLPGAKEPSVHLSDWPMSQGQTADASFMAQWSRVLEVREVAFKTLEESRQQKKIGKSQEAKIIVSCGDAALLSILQQYQEWLPSLCIVSQVELKQGPQTNGQDTASVEVIPADGTKCVRCWNYLTTVGQDAEHPGLCHRCVEVVKSLPAMSGGSKGVA